MKSKVKNNYLFDYILQNFQNKEFDRCISPLKNFTFKKFEFGKLQDQ
jgi:hypothetical protein